MRESREVKGRRYLTEGRLTVMVANPTCVLATVRGSAAVYTTSWMPETGWRCDCEARGQCSHLVALQLVALPPTEEAAA